MGVSGVILAAGGSIRLGRPKQLLILDGEPIVRIVVRHALASRLAEVILVLGSDLDEVALAVGALGQRNVYNPAFAKGQSTSMRAGLSAVSPKSDAVLFLLGDQPEVGTNVIDALVGSFEQTGSTIVQPVYGGTPANPVLIARTLFSELEQVTGDLGARSVVKRHAASVLRVPVSDGSPPGDVDTDEDYAALVERWARREEHTAGNG